MKGSIVISETMLSAVGILISFILIILVVQLVFSQQTARTYESGFESIARDISLSIDRAAASTASMMITHEIPRGMNFDMSIDYKSILIKYDGNLVPKFFTALTHSGSYEFKNPEKLCIIKTSNDRRILFKDKECNCNTKDNVCDPECSIDSICDFACVTGDEDYVCNPFCKKDGDGVCDPDCYRNETDEVFDPDCIDLENNPDGVCDPDSDNIKDTKCDIDCYLKYFNGTSGVCDPDCPSEDTNIIKDNGGLKVKISDGYCYTGCINKSKDIDVSGVQICDMNDQTIWQCLIVSRTGDYSSTNYRDYENHLWACGRQVSWCAGELCDQTPGQNYRCHITKVNPQMFPHTSTCCCIEDDCEKITREECLKKGGVVYLENDNRCLGKTTKKTATQKDYSQEIIKLPYDGICDQDCNNTVNICDPDCPNSFPCGDICIEENQDCSIFACCEGLVCSPGTDTCVKNPCANGICETYDMWDPGHSIYWENCYTCPADCGSCSEPKPSCSKGSFTSSICYNDNLEQGTYESHWTKNTIQVCHDDVVKFLDRREWDINILAETTIKSDTPDGWAFSASRYFTQTSPTGSCTDRENTCYVQPAIKTINANEMYDKNFPNCCIERGCCYSAGQPQNSIYYGPECEGIGYCSDDAVALLTILRTLGVPAEDVYAVFSRDIKGSGRSHAFVVYKCDPNLEPRLRLRECDDYPDNTWLQVDITGHFIQPLKESADCPVMCLWYNDYGLYASSTEGKYSSTHGYVFPSGLGCSMSSECDLDKLCDPADTGIKCMAR